MICVGGEPKARRSRGAKPRLTDDQSRLVGEHMKDTRRVVRKYAGRYPSLADEFQSAAHEAIIHAVRHYDPSSGCVFSTFLFARLNGAMIDVLRQVVPLGYRRRGELVRVWPLSHVPEYLRDSVAYDRIGDPPGDEFLRVDAFERLTRTLPPKHRLVMRRRFVDEKNQLDIAREIDVCESRVSQMIAESIGILRERFKGRRDLEIA